jgi:hypothetical protein
MGDRGRKSGADLQVVSTVSREERPAAPDVLTDAQADVWDAVVSRLPASWFPRETHELLVQYCCHAVSQKRISSLIQAHEVSEEFDLDEYDKLLKMQEREGRALSSLATRMRITQQATYDKSKKKPKSSKALWSGN